jgi:hypothetical protein
MKAGARATEKGMSESTHLRRPAADSERGLAPDALPEVHAPGVAHGIMNVFDS